MKKFTYILCLLALFKGFSQDSIPSMDSLDLAIGQMILIGLGDFDEPNSQAPIFDEIREGKVGGIILFEKNLATRQTAEKLKDLITYTQAQSSTPLFVSIDEEGGSVTRLKTKYGFPDHKSAKYFGNKNRVDTTFFYAERTAYLLDSLGINMNFAPCVDVNINPQNPVIGKIGRSFSPNDTTVARHAYEVIRAQRAYGIISVLKHFPGHGSSESDTHLGVADVSDTWMLRELYPYKFLLDSGMVDAIMTAHIVNRSLDEDLLPATLSKPIVSGLLRDFLKYDGVVVSDDLQMRAISDHFGLRETIKRSILSGIDILLFANNVPDYDLVTATKIHEIIKEMVSKNEIPTSRIWKSYQRISKLKKIIGLIE